MDYPTLPYVVEPLAVSDIDEIMAIEREAFSAPWTPSAYRHELLRNEMARYYVVRQHHAPVHARTRSPLRSLLAKSPPSGASALPPILAYGGFWIMVDEAHISTIASAHEWRGKGLGELLLIGMIEHAHEFGVEKVTLEVRVSNTVAQNLYHKYGFEVEGRRRRYYSDNGEDALIMTTPPIYEDAFERRLEALKTKLAERLRSETT
ncbi:MAG: ribosomal protein S18-alanine N-acetyltransferase [Chloroflexi bacterium]|nr:ribosomal protein S18-alanine N-acetyltransferase [Chloroflexota bacterium]